MKTRRSNLPASAAREKAPMSLMDFGSNDESCAGGMICGVLVHVKKVSRLKPTPWSQAESSAGRGASEGGSSVKNLVFDDPRLRMLSVSSRVVPRYSKT